MMQFLFSVNIVWGIACVLLYLVCGINPQNFWIFSISSLLVPISFGINLMFIFWWLIFKWQYAILSFLILVLGFSHLQKFYAWNDPNPSPKCRNNNFNLMTFNVYGLKNLKDTIDQSQQKNKNQFLSFLRKTDPEILCVQENNLYADNVINSTGLFSYVHYMINHGTAIYSKFPILDHGLIDFGTNTNSCLWADILINGRRTRIYSVHLQSNRISKDVNTLTDDDEEKSIEKLNVIKRMLVQYRRMSLRRARQAEMVSTHANGSEYPVIIAGDFNDTPFSYAYRQLSKKRKDSFLENGNGIGSTYVGALPGLRIDFILSDEKKFSFCNHKVLQTSFSDHNPVMTSMYYK
ncbi:MAG: endonuclease/exonuclease/phosphatase family protein [Saprospiraceae bacterium]|nr:endonuclease/exonuclease/phosphatase family protein [Candidatus Vicinibacter proximus]MBL7824740.1 endonuclease/exonuclease/phosphatase family protein [Saprospiraceae bacterium]MCC6843938.1 endonuclease/exonuclease/phosphatase family protein [Saprospiraceae bacterium]HRG32356.1 endonuclease/exonuclease/phosphatase family protein [Saprospiraceae bacterium]